MTCSHAVLHGLYWLVANIAERGPTVLAIDDAHWADGPSLRFVGFLSRRLEGMGVLVVLASRRDEPGAQAALLRGVCQEADVRPIQPRLLSHEAVERIVRMRLGETSSEDLCAACHDATGGNPFLLGELLLELHEEKLARGFVAPAAVTRVGPQSVASTVLGRLGRLAEAATSLAQAVAILGERVDLGHAGALAGLEREVASSAADLLVSASILERGRPLAFVHPIVRTAIYEDISPAERSRAHARAARLLSDDGAALEAVALQLLATEPAQDRWVLQTLRQAACAALERGAPEIAVRYLSRALDEARHERVEVLVELGSAEARAADPAARAHLTAALEHAGDP